MLKSPPGKLPGEKAGARWFFRLIGLLLLSKALFILYGCWVAHHRLEYHPDRIQFTIVRILFSAGWFSMGTWLAVSGAHALKRLLLALVPFIAMLAVIEILLASGLFRDERSGYPVWIPPELAESNDKINAANAEFAMKNPLGFTDFPRSPRKAPGARRLLVIGDSFIAGSGLPWREVWSHRLEEMYRAAGSNIEVVSWGRSGWSTLEEFEYLKKHGGEIEFDMLIFNFCTNDPDMGGFEQRILIWHLSPSFDRARRFLPNTFSFFHSHLNNILQRFFLKEWGYHSWEKKLWTDDNLAGYSRVLRNLAEWCRERNIPLLFFLTPSNHDEYFEKRYEQLKPLLDEAGIRYLDALPVVRRDLGRLPTHALKANPADGHPGKLMHEVFAKAIFESRPIP